MAKNILITGASGLIGHRLTELLMQKGYQVSHLSRTKSEGPIPTYVWDVKKMTMDPQALQNKDAIIHLAGAGIADKPWTQARKKELLESRTESTRLLAETLKNENHSVTSFISASAIGYYGFGGSDEEFTEEGEAGSDFLATVVKQWESAVDKVIPLGLRVVKLRIGIVFSEKGGALAEMVKPIKWGFGAPLGSGNQFMSWIHLDDLCRMFIHALEQPQMQGVYNATGTEPITNKELTRISARLLKKPLWLPNVPAFVLKIMLGEMADLVLKGSKVSSAKIRNTGFELAYSNLELALKELLLKSKSD